MSSRAFVVACLVAVVSTAALAFILMPASDAGAAAATEPAAAGDRPAAGDRSAAGARPAAGARFSTAGVNLSRIWWNQPRPVEALGLTDEQRKKMDALLIDSLGRRRELAQGAFEVRQTLGDHLAAGDWKAAEKDSDDLAERASILARSDADLTLAVVRLLQPEQRRTLDQELPMILRRAWLQGGVGLRQGRSFKPGGRARQQG